MKSSVPQQRSSLPSVLYFLLMELAAKDSIPAIMLSRTPKFTVPSTSSMMQGYIFSNPPMTMGDTAQKLFILLTRHSWS